MQKYIGANPGMLPNTGVFNSQNIAVYSYSYYNPLYYKDPDGNSPESALKLISSNRVIINSAARSAGVNPQQVASIIFQEKLNGRWADAKNAFLAWPQIMVGATDASIGLAEMDVNTAARILGIKGEQKIDAAFDKILEILNDDEMAIQLIAGNIADFEEKLNRDVNLKEATFGHNTGIESLEKNLPIEEGSDVSRRSLGYQKGIADALNGKIDARPDSEREKNSE